MLNLYHTREAFFFHTRKMTDSDNVLQFAMIERERKGDIKNERDR